MEVVNHVYHIVTLQLYRVDMFRGGVCLSRGFLSHPLLSPSIPPSVHGSPASLTTLTVHTKGVRNSTEIQKSVVIVVMTIVNDIIIDYSQL